MSNEYYTPSGVPASNSDVTSNTIRSEFAAMSAGLDKLPTMAGNVGNLVYVQSASKLAAATADALGLATQVELDAAILAEANSRSAADATEVTNRNSAINSAIATEVTNRNAAILVETNARIADVNAEEAARIAADALLVTLSTVQTITGKKLFAPTGTAEPGNVEVDVLSDQTGVYIDMAGSSSNGLLIDTNIATGNNFVQFRYTNSTPVSVGSITTNSTTTSYNTTSDYRLKDNVLPLANCWDTILALNPVEFTWKANGYIDQGFIAHEVQAVLPNAVTGEKDGDEYQSMDAKFMIPFLVKAVQDLHARLLLLEGVQ